MINIWRKNNDFLNKLKELSCSIIVQNSYVPYSWGPAIQYF